MTDKSRKSPVTPKSKHDRDHLKQVVQKESVTSVRESSAERAKARLFGLIRTFFYRTKHVEAPHLIFARAVGIAGRLQSAPLALLVTLLFIGLFAWSIFAKIDQFTSIPGRVVPMGNIMKIQHLEGGIIQDILVEAGQVVAKGDLIAEVLLSGLNKSLNEIKAELGGLYLRRNRLQAEHDEKPLTLDPALIILYPDIARTEKEAYKSRLRTIDQERRLLMSKLEQENITRREIESRIGSVERELDALQEKLTVQSDLAEEGLISHFDVLELEARVEEIKGRRQSAKESRSLALSRKNETQTRLDTLTDLYRDRVLEELLSIENRIETLQLAQDRVEKRDLRREVRSPAAGIIKEVFQTTPGAVIRPGEVLIDLVPQDNRLIVEAYLPTAERGKITEGHDVLVKVSAYDFIRFGGLEGHVQSISADAFVDENKGSYYKVLIETDRTWLGEDENTAPITPGMDVIADIKSDRRRVITYLLYPVLNLKNNAFRQ